MNAEGLLVSVLGTGAQGLAQEMRRLVIGEMDAADARLTDSVFELLRTNMQLWTSETEVRAIRFNPWKTAKLQRRIASLNSRRAEMTLAIDSSVTLALASTSTASSVVLSDSIGQVVDQLSIRTIRLETRRFQH
jgi:hypothetical protein